MAALAMTYRDRPLADMLLQANHSGLTWRELARRAQDHGHEVSAAHLNNLANGHVRKMPDERDISAIAAAIGRPREEVLTAALREFYGNTYRAVDVSGDPRTRRLVAVPEDATEDDVAEIARLVNAWWEARRKD